MNEGREFYKAVTLPDHLVKGSKVVHLIQICISANLDFDAKWKMGVSFSRHSERASLPSKI